MIPWRGAGAIAGLALAMLTACVDTSPIDYVAAGSADASADGASSAAAVDAGLIAACKECITEGACKSQYQGCAANQKCATELNCLLDIYCLNWSATDAVNLPPCILGCSADAGVTQTDPSVAVFVPVLFCAQDKTACAAVCDVGMTQ
jgi:hypothetical protein